MLLVDALGSVAWSKRTRLGLASDLVAGSGEGLLGLVEGGLGGVGSLRFGQFLSDKTSVRFYQRTSFSPALVWKSLRIASDMFAVVWDLGCGGW
jgi:hypothetical protein